MRLLAAGIVILVAACACSVATADEAADTARDFSYDTITFGTTLEDFQKKFPIALLTDADKSNGTKTYLTKTSDDRIFHVNFFHGKAYRLCIMFDSDAITKIGGASVLKNKMVETFGVPTRTVDGRAVWELPAVNRRVGIVAIPDHGMVGFYFADTKVEVQVNKEQVKNLDLGF